MKFRAGSAQTHKSMSFIWIIWSTLYVYLWGFVKQKIVDYSTQHEWLKEGRKDGWMHGNVTTALKHDSSNRTWSVGQYCAIIQGKTELLGIFLYHRFVSKYLIFFKSVNRVSLKKKICIWCYATKEVTFITKVKPGIFVFHCHSLLVLSCYACTL